LPGIEHAEAVGKILDTEYEKSTFACNEDACELLSYLALYLTRRKLSNTHFPSLANQQIPAINQ
jgi:hypothetical protein